MMEEVEIKWEQRLKFSPRGHLHRHHDAVAALDARLPGDVLHTTPFAFCPCFLVVFFSGTRTWREKKEPPEDQDAGLGAKSLAGLYINYAISLLRMWPNAVTQRKNQVLKK